MQKTGRRMLITLVALLLTASVAVTASYAWFELGPTASAGFNVQVAAKAGLLVAAAVGDDMSAVEYYTNLPFSVLNDAYDFETVRVSDVTPTLTDEDATVQDGRLLLEGYTDSRGNTEPTGSNVDLKNGELDSRLNDEPNYYEFTLWFKAKKAYTICLDMAHGATSVVSAPDFKDSPYWDEDQGSKRITYSFWPIAVTLAMIENDTIPYCDKGYYTSKYGENPVSTNDRVLADASNALRIGMHRVSVDDSLIIVNPNYNKGYYKGNFAHDIHSDNYNTTEAMQVLPKYNNDTKEFENEFETVEDWTGYGYTAVVNTGLKLERKFIGDPDNDAYYGELTFTVWIEGKDGDCFNSIMADLVTTKLIFLGIEKENPNP